ncbi:MAG: hypothetical protein COX62_01320 [Deltaproteobacteria bacterium CG_4_10_14_0_2_um_filter_43_8]|nr:MAG: hypothetical protein COV43_05280 [Deltaproteobacteria bacterium CG11_big_fil_rev_8_21_14_0_20_42_23]PJA21833.1 MAG: hypothetical protein COX62_01320 [Deltaproteobacteria bacterium CG_4_10_14_0_2_um_filter_43_8]PJC64004.1 MAG: hypothetical protein CO021_06255 [Deltaproteobacteria bacterium CG_4_9_14_0_2_um_filter_42_21]
MKPLKLIASFFFLLVLFSFASAQTLHAASEEKELGTVSCQLSFNLKSWSVFYKSGKGTGTISCDNGQTASVKIRTKGGGISFGKNEIVNGKGTFSKVHDIEKLFGGYAQSEAHAGASSSASAAALWNGNVGLTLSGKGKGWDLGFAFGHFKITPLP